ncbi:MAG TPA: hypothetical protein VG844_16030 [Terracidiphilus sp.]|nr:hypothetical protein [Terracidiphilus sp.]
MKIAAAIARYLLGLMFVVFGANMFFSFIPQGPMPTGLPGDFMVAMFKAHYFYPVGAVMILSGVLFLANRFVPLALVFLGPVLVNILLFHILMLPATIGMGLFATLLWFLVFYQHRAAFAPLFRAKA